MLGLWCIGDVLKGYVRRAPRLEVLVYLVVFLQATGDVVDGGAQVAGGAVLSEFAASEADEALCLPGAGDWVCRGFFQLPCGWVYFEA